MGITVHTTNRKSGSQYSFADRNEELLKYPSIPSSPGAIATVTPVLPGLFTTLPVISTTGPGSGNTFAVHMSALSGVPFAAGSGYATGDTSTLTGGTGTAPILTVSNTKLVSSAVNAAGTLYAPGDQLFLVGGTFTIAAVLQVATTKLITAAVLAPGINFVVNDTVTLGGGTFSVAAILTVSKIQLVSAALNAAGSTYAPGDVLTLVGGTSTTAAQITVDTVNGGGNILTFHISRAGVYTVGSTTFTVTGGAGTGATFNTGVFGIQATTTSTPGSYTVNTLTFTQSATSGSGTGATFNTGVYGVNTTTTLSAGVYTVNSTTFTTTTSGSGTGATINTGLFGINTASVTTAGNLTALAANPAAQGATSGAGTGATFTMAYGILSVTVGGSGTLYDSTSAIITTPTGGATFTSTLSNTNGVVTVPIAYGNMPANVHVAVDLRQPGSWYSDPTSYTATGFNILVTPVSGSAITAGTISVKVSS